MKSFLHDFLIALALTLLIGGMILLLVMGFLSKPSPMEPRKSERLSVEELQH